MLITRLRNTRITLNSLQPFRPQPFGNYPARACAARGYVIGCGVYIICTFFWNQSFISQNTHFQRSILTQIGFSSNLMASGIA